jgi:hypothetical protein
MKIRILIPSLALLFIAAGNAFGQQIDPSALYRITAKHSGKCLAVAGGNSFVNNGVGVIQWDCADTENNQKWQIIPVDGGLFKIIASHSGKSLDVRGGVDAQGNGAPVHQFEYLGNANQKWKLVPLGDGYYQIIASHSGKSLDINGGPGARDNGPHAQQWDWVNGDNQKFRLTALPDLVTGTFRYKDSEVNPDGSGFAEFFRPIVGCKVQVWRAGRLVTTTETDSNGSFTTIVSHLPSGTDTTVLLYATNTAAQVLAGVGPYFIRKTLVSSGVAPLAFSEDFETAEQVRSFNAAEDIRLARTYALARREPHERDVIPVVDVSFIDHDNAGTRYNHPASSLMIHRDHSAVDLVVMHEYAHFLEDKIGSFLVLPSYHDGCFASQRCLIPAECANLPGLPAQTQLINSPENAWMEGFADYFAMAVKRANPSGRFNLTTGGTMSEDELNRQDTCPAVERAAFDGRTITGEMVESYVARVLWYISDGGSADLAVFRAFDHELDFSASHLLPNIRRFHDTWRSNFPGQHSRFHWVLTLQHITTIED